MPRKCQLIMTNLKLGITLHRISELKENVKANMSNSCPGYKVVLCASCSRSGQHLLTSLQWQGSHSLTRELLCHWCFLESSYVGREITLLLHPLFQLLILEQRSANFSRKGPGNKYFKLHGPHCLCCNFSTLWSTKAATDNT